MVGKHSIRRKVVNRVREIVIGGKTIKNYSEPYIIAEIGANHNGYIKLAKKMIDIAKEEGADAVKFQSWSKYSIFLDKFMKNYFLVDDYEIG